jgi:uncharacterized membrane protein
MVLDTRSQALPLVRTSRSHPALAQSPSLPGPRRSTTSRSPEGLPEATTKNPFSLGDFGSGTWTTLDPSSGFVAATGRYVVPYTGYYRVDGLLNISSVFSATATVTLKKNGSAIFTSLGFNVNITSVPIAFSYIDLASNIGDYYDVSITAAGSYLNAEAGSSFSVQRIQA